jgi:hypothetical protein
VDCAAEIHGVDVKGVAQALLLQLRLDAVFAREQPSERLAQWTCGATAANALAHVGTRTGF